MVKYGMDYDESVPLHFEQLFFEICQKKINIKMTKNAFMNLKNKTIEKILCCEYFAIFQNGKTESISLYKVLNICPNLIRIYSDFIVLNDENVKMILKILKQSVVGKLREIHIVLNNNQSPNIQKIFNAYRELRKCHWKLLLDGNLMKFSVI